MTSSIPSNTTFIPTIPPKLVQPTSSLRYAIALWDYQSQEDNELSFVAGDRILIKEFCNDDWYEGTLNGVTAYFPANHVRVLQPEVVSQSQTIIASEPSPIQAPFSPTFQPVYERLAAIGNEKENTIPPASRQPATSNPQIGSYESIGIPSASLKDLYGTAISAAELDSDVTGTARNSEALSTQSVTLQHGQQTSGSGSDEYIADDDWQVVTAEDGTTYYWNCATGETSWDPPYGRQILDSLDQLNLHDEGTSFGKETPSSKSQSPPMSPNAKSHGTIPHLKNGGAVGTIEYVPMEMIRREGLLMYKIKKEFGGIEPKKAHSWHTAWAIVVLGFLIFYKDDPARLRKKGEKIVPPLFVINLERVTIKKEAKEATKKKSGFSIETRSGGLWMLLPATEQEVPEWMTTIEEATRESCSAVEYESAIAKLYAPAPSLAEMEQNQIRKDKKNTASKSSKGEGLEDDEPTKASIKAKLNNFFKRTGDKPGEKSDKEKDPNASSPSVLPHAIFGGSIIAQMDNEQSKIPLFVKLCITEIDNKGLQSQGIYRLSGNAATIQRIKALANETMTAHGLFDESVDVNVIAGLLKLYLRELADPIIPFEYYDRFIGAMKLEDYNDRLIEIKNLVQELPRPHYEVLEYLVRHLQRVATHSDVNKMEPSNLAIVFGPSIIRVRSTGNDDMGAAYANMINMSYQNSLIEAIIVQTDWLFDGSPN